jgi:hypothetical protein
LAGSLCLALGSTAAANALPFDQLDQEFVISSPLDAVAIQAGHSVAQTFTVGITGQLSRIELQIGRAASVPADLTVEIRKTTSSGEPDISAAGLLATFDLSPSVIPVEPFPTTLVGVDLGSSAVPVVAGELLAILLEAQVPTFDWYLWVYADPDRHPGIPSYSGGSMWEILAPALPGLPPPIHEGATYDAAFRTFVPEPGTGLLVMTGMLGLAARRRLAARLA